MNKNKYSELSILFILLLTIGLIYSAHALYFTGLFQESDGLRHYHISRYSWKYPILFLELWGKPFFTLISSPFSQFGLLGIKFFNIVCALLTCICIFRIAGKLEIKRRLLSVVFLGFTSLYFYMAISGFTELFFGLVLTFCILLFLENKYTVATLLISFLPFIRSEGYLLLPLFMVVLIMKRKFLIVLLLPLATIVYSIIGYFVYHDLFWLKTQNPYTGEALNIYGHGTFFHFFNDYSVIWGAPLALLTIAGLIYAAITVFRKKFSGKKYFKEEIFLVYGSFLVYFFAHCIFWWKGLFNSFGLDRVMGAVLPLSAIISLEGFNFGLSFVSGWKKISVTITIIVVALVVINPFLENYFPLKPEPEVQLVLDVKKWYENSELKSKKYKIYFLHPNLPDALSFDPYDKKCSSELWGLYSLIDKWGYGVVPDSSLIIWDAHYGPNEGGIEFEKLMSDTNFRLIKSFLHEEPFLTLGNRPFEIHVFQKLKRGKNSNKVIREIFNDFESDANAENTYTLTNDRSFSGERSSLLNNASEFSASISDITDSIPDIENVHCINIEFMIQGKGKLESTAVVSFHSGGNQVAYYSFPIRYDFKKEEWLSLNWHWLIDPDKLKKADSVKMYIWNYKKETFCVDDFNLKYLSNCY